MKHLFIDTNVVIDLLTQRQPFSALALNLFKSASEKQARLYVSALSCANIYYIIRRFKTREEALQNLHEPQDLVEIINVDGKIIGNAIASGFNDFEDAIQYHCALSNPSIEAIVTRNQKDFKKSTIPVLTVEEVLGNL